MMFLWKPIDFIKSISSRNSLSSVSIALAKSKKLEMVNADTIAYLSFRLKSRTKAKCRSSNDYCSPTKQLPKTSNY